MTVLVKNGNCLEVMQTMTESTACSIVTDPPYGLSFMGKEWDHGIPGKAFWTEAFRVAKPGAHLLAFGGTRTYHRLACAIEDAEWEIRDCVMWVYGSGFPKSHNLDGEWKGWGTALKPAWEPIIVARKPLVGTVAENVAQHGTGAINVDGCRVGAETRTNNSSGIPGAGRMRACNQIDRGDGKTPDGRNLANVIAYAERSKNRKPQEVTGRWPANLIHDGSDEVVGLFPQSNGGAFPKKSNAPTGKHYDGGWGAVHNGKRTEMGNGSAARFFYCAKASKADRDDGCEGLEAKSRGQKYGLNAGGSTSQQTPHKNEPQRNHHPTVKPTALIRYLCRLVTPPGGVVLDPFMGSGSTGKAAVMEGFDFIGIEQNKEYCEIAEARIKKAGTGQLELIR